MCPQGWAQLEVALEVGCTQLAGTYASSGGIRGQCLGLQEPEEDLECAELRSGT